MFFKKKKQPLNLESLVKPLLRNAISVTLGKSGSPLAPDSSKLGGKPCLPKDFEWPHFEGSTYDGETANRPLSFLCQINLADVATLDTENLLPQTGLLCFFYEMESMCWGFDPADEGCARVYYFENLQDLTPTDFPETLSEEYVVKEYPLRFKAGKSAPSWEELDCHLDVPDGVDWDAYDEMLEDMGMVLDAEHSKLLGYADLIQGEMLTECERCRRGLYCGDHASYVNTPQEVKDDIQKHAADWQLLLQLASVTDDDCELMWGDCGNLYFYITKEDLAARRFDRVWLALQCG